MSWKTKARSKASELMANSGTSDRNHPGLSVTALECGPTGAAAAVPLAPKEVKELEGANPDAQIAAIVASSGTSFFWAMRFLPKAKRRAMFAVYAFCRVVDNIADGDATPDEKRTELAAWRKEINLLYEGKPRHTISRVLQAPIADYGLAIEDFIALIEGMEMDASGRMVAPSMAELKLYCQHVAGAVGLLSVRIFGIEGEAGRALALSLGEALQLSNVLRDLAEDARLGRLYLPRELLERHGIEERDPIAVLAHPALPLACADLAETAEGCFVVAREILDAYPRRNGRPARVMMNIYHALLRHMKAKGFDRFDEPVKLSKGLKLWIALREGLL